MRHSDIGLTVDHLFPGAEADAIGRLAGAFSRPELPAATGTDGGQQRAAFGTALRPRNGANPATRCMKKEGSSANAGATDLSQFPRESVVLPTVLGEEFESSGGEIRTPDMRIIIPQETQDSAILCMDQLPGKMIAT